MLHMDVDDFYSDDGCVTACCATVDISTVTALDVTGKMLAREPSFGTEVLTKGVPMAPDDSPSLRIAQRLLKSLKRDIRSIKRRLDPGAHSQDNVIQLDEFAPSVPPDSLEEKLVVGSALSPQDAGLHLKFHAFFSYEVVGRLHQAALSMVQQAGGAEKKVSLVSKIAGEAYMLNLSLLRLLLLPNSTSGVLNSDVDTTQVFDFIKGSNVAPDEAARLMREAPPNVEPHFNLGQSGKGCRLALKEAQKKAEWHTYVFDEAPNSSGTTRAALDLRRVLPESEHNTWKRKMEGFASAGTPVEEVLQELLPLWENEHSTLNERLGVAAPTAPGGGSFMELDGWTGDDAKSSASFRGSPLTCFSSTSPFWQAKWSGHPHRGHAALTSMLRRHVIFMPFKPDSKACSVHGQQH
jgi:hypothetical protein